MELSFAVLLGLFLTFAGYVVFRGFQLLGRTIEPDPNERGGCGKLLLAWCVWLLMVAVVAVVMLPYFTPGARSAARRSQCTSHLTQILLAMHGYRDKHGTFPPAYTVDKTGRPLHSWRVLLLPFMEQKDLYERIRLDEPWDSPYNRAVFDPAKSDNQHSHSMPCVFSCPEDGENRTETNYVMVLGPHTLSNGPNSVSFRDITDGAFETVAVVETCDLGIHWYEPRDLRVEEMSFKINDPEYFGIASRHPGGAQVGLVDASVRFLPNDTDPRTLEAMTTINGGERISVALP